MERRDVVEVVQRKAHTFTWFTRLVGGVAVSASVAFGHGSQVSSALRASTRDRRYPHLPRAIGRSV
jgi:hypothetical protein